MSKKLDTDAVRQAAEGNWPAILSTLGGVPIESLDGKHHPCPKCGGEDRFRAFDDGSGGLICNQCFNKENGDGFASLQWLLGCKFPEAVKQVAQHLGIEATKKSKADPAKDLNWQPWSSGLVGFFLAKKPGVTEESLLAAGAKLAKYKNHTVIALPIIGQSLDIAKPVGWVLMNYNGGTLPKWNRDGDVVGQVKIKITYGSKPGLIGVHAIERMQAEGLPELVWKVEGVSDLLALWSTIPDSLKDRHLVVTNANGASETPRWPAAILANHDTNVLHDADEPGQAGAEQWARAIAAQGASAKVRNVTLPYVIEPKSGNDLRDWLAEKNNYGDLLNLADQCEPIEVVKTESGEIDYTQASYPVQDQILKRLQIEVLYEDEAGLIRVFSTLLRKSSSIRQVDRLKVEALIQMCGPPAMEHISTDPDGDQTFSLTDVRKAIALAAASRRGKNDERGVGVWQGVDDFGNETKTIVMVGDTEAARWNGDKVLRRIIAPRADGLVLDFGSGSQDWYDFDLLERNLLQAENVEWCEGVIEQAFKLFSRWRWKNDEIDPTIITGLVMATWIQTIWAWRPLVSVVGESNSGKSFLFEALGGSDHRQGIFGRLAFKQAKSTEAGLRQGIGNTACIAICDEFEKSKERDRILEMLRASTRGEITARGTSGQKGKQYKLRHIGWVAAIEAGLQKQPDVNRFVQLELIKPERQDHGKLELPDGHELYLLGQKLLAIAVSKAVVAKSMAVRLKSTKANDVDARTVECYSVPASILGAALGFDQERTAGLLIDLLAGVERSEQGRTDQEDLLDSILTASINCGGKDGWLSVGQIIEDTNSQRFYDHAGKLEAAGIRLTKTGDLFVYHRQITRGLLRGTQWEGQRLDQLLLRINGAEKDSQRLAGRPLRGVTLPSTELGKEPEANETVFSDL